MNETIYARISLPAAHDTYYHLEQAAIGLRAAMDEANHADDYGREAELGDMLTHILLALANLPPKTDDFPF